MKYDDNKVMRLLGNQYYNQCFSNEDIRNIRDILTAYKNDDDFDLDMLCVDCAVYGFLMGKRAERYHKKTGKKWLE